MCLSSDPIAVEISWHKYPVLYLPPILLAVVLESIGYASASTESASAPCMHEESQG